MEITLASKGKLTEVHVCFQGVSWNTIEGSTEGARDVSVKNMLESQYVREDHTIPSIIEET